LSFNNVMAVFIVVLGCFTLGAFACLIPNRFLRELIIGFVPLTIYASGDYRDIVAIVYSVPWNVKFEVLETAVAWNLFPCLLFCVVPAYLGRLACSFAVSKLNDAKVDDKE
jgi:hypothetical protein